jgi:uncharacterized repeat protein (TIGR03803 family)
MKKRIMISALALCFSVGFSAQDYELWGVTQQSGDNNKGTIYKTDSIGQNHEVLYSFTDGSKPTGALLLASNGMLYGTTAFGGSVDYGIVFSFDPVAETFTKISDLDGATGGRPRGGFMQASNGMLYLTTFEGGAHAKGTILELNPSTNQMTVRYSFGATSTDPKQPLASVLLEATNGKLYGLTRYGGQYDDGTIYEYELTNHTVTKLFDFSSASNGGQPFNSLIQASNGLLYGTTYAGGPTDKGGIFAYDIAMDTFATQEMFSNAGSVGTKPQGALVEASNGLLYGMTSSSGYLFSFDVTTTDVTPIQGVGDARSTLIQASNGKLYGTTYTGSLIQYDVMTDDYSGQGSIGIYSLYGHLTEVPTASSIGIESAAKENQMNVYPNPTTGVVNLETEEEIVAVKVFSIHGKLMMTPTSANFSVESLNSGIYLVVVQTANELHKVRLVKE